MKLTALIKLVAFTLLAVSPSAFAANVYKPGTQGHEMAEFVGRFLETDMTVLFLRADDYLHYVRQVDEAAYAEAGLGSETLSYLANGALRMFSDNNTRMNAYATSSGDIPGNEEKASVCGIVFGSSDKVTMDTIFHEAMHCKTGAYLTNDEYTFQRLKAYYNVKPYVEMSNFVNMFEEAMAAHLQVAYFANEGVSEGIEMVRREAGFDQNGVNSLGVRTARSALEMCGTEGACSTDTLTLAASMMSSPALMEDIKQDMLERHARYQARQ